jgi:hypothetical protein
MPVSNIGELLLQLPFWLSVGNCEKMLEIDGKKLDTGFYTDIIIALS